MRAAAPPRPKPRVASDGGRPHIGSRRAGTVSARACFGPPESPAHGSRWSRGGLAPTSLAGVSTSSPGVPDPSDRSPVDAGGMPPLEFDQVLSQLVDRAQELMGTQNRLRGLLAANTEIIGNLALPVVLRRIVEVALELVNARYGALGVLAPVGGLEEFIHVGMDDDAVEKIGNLPAGKGLLGALIDDPRPIRLTRIADDSRSVGFPANHPPMSSFLGVPIRVRNEVFGNVYLSES